MDLPAVLRNLFASSNREERLSGLPTSSNGASSHHLFWQLPAVDEPIISVSVTIEVIEAPSVDRLYFWAVQASFAQRRATMGSGHLGLQHHPQYPEAGALNWGGYHSAASGRTGELDGSPLRAPSALENANTCNYPWRPGTEYRYRIAQRETGAWTGAITDVERGHEMVVRDLYCSGDTLRDVVMWTEAFARCDDPPTAIRWSEPIVTTSGGARIRPDSMLVNYQRVPDGGCSTSNSERTTDGFVQRTGVVRTTPAGTLLRS